MNIDIGKLANSLDMPTEDLNLKLQYLGMLEVVSEARRLAHQEVFGTGKMDDAIKGGLKVKHQHLVEACKGIFAEVEITTTLGELKV